jgi:hypothetical protein
LTPEVEASVASLALELHAQLKRRTG